MKKKICIVIANYYPEISKELLKGSIKVLKYNNIKNFKIIYSPGIFEIPVIISRNIDNTHIIFNAGILDKKSKLRANFEKNKNLICIPFYSDDSNTLGKLANNFFREKKISISQETINLLVEKCKGDRENLKNELLKIEVYSKDKTY